MNELLPLDKALERAQAMDVFGVTGLSLPEKLEPIEYYCLGVQVQITDDSIGWCRADLALRIKTDFDKNYRELWRQFLPKYSYDTLENDARTAMRYTPQERYQWTIEDSLTYSHCRVASHLQPDDYREDVLRQARDLGWTVRQLENFIATGSPDRPAPRGPSRDVRKRYNEWLDTLDAEDGYHWDGLEMSERKMAERFVSEFLEWLESQ